MRISDWSSDVCSSDLMSVDVRTNEDLRPSRLVKSISSYVRRSLVTIFRVFVTYRPLFFFFWLATLLALPGLLLGVRFLYFYFSGEGAGHIQSLILASLTLMLAALAGISGIIADLIATNRKLLERINQNMQETVLFRPDVDPTRQGEREHH